MVFFYPADAPFDLPLVFSGIELPGNENHQGEDPLPAHHSIGRALQKFHAGFLPLSHTAGGVQASPAE